MIKMSSLLERLTFLEELVESQKLGVKTLKEEVLVLQSENFDMQKEIFVLKKKNNTLSEKLESMDKALTNVVRQNRSAAMHTTGLDSSDMESRVHCLESEAPSLKAALSKVESELTTSKKKMTTLDDTVKKMEIKVSCIESDHRATKRKISTLDNTVKTVVLSVEKMSVFHKVLNRAMVAKQGAACSDIDTKLANLETRTVVIENRLGDASQSVTHILVDTRDKRLDTHHYVKLDTCDRVYINGGMYDHAQGCLIASSDGDFGVSVRYAQKGHGVILIWLKWDGSWGQVVGRTHEDWEVTCGVTVLRLRKGQKFWLEANRHNGDAEILWCDLVCWLL